MNLLLILIWTFHIYVYFLCHDNTCNMYYHGMEISSVDFLNIFEVILNILVSKIMILLDPLFILFQALHLKFCSSSHTTLWFQNVSLSLSSHSFWGKQAAMSEAALCKCPCDKDLKLPATSQQKIKTVNNQVSLAAILQSQLSLDMTGVPTRSFTDILCKTLS